MASELNGTNATTSNGTSIEDCDDKTTAKGSKDLKYPKHVFFIIGNEFCERFCYYGNRTILAIYLQSKLGYSEDSSTIIYHIFVMLCYFFPIFGAIVSDSYLGKYRTILYLSILYCFGNITLSAASNYSSSSSNQTFFSLLGLFLIALGTGGIKPCVSSFGGDQFVLPQQERLLASFFSVFYFSINAGSLISTFLTPELRTMSCLGQDSCYPLAFGIPAALMVTSLVIFVCGKSMYTIKTPEGNILVDVSKCIWRGIYKKISSKEKKEHWLDYAEDKYSSQLVRDTKILMELIYLFSPTILFWALYEQQGSRWTFQAENMGGKIWGFVIKPDQMQTINPILVLALIPIFDLAVYPLLAKLKLIKTSLQKLFWGGIVAAVAFGISAFVEYKVQDSYAVLPQPGSCQLRVYNTYMCPLHIDGQYRDDKYSWTVSGMSVSERLTLPVSGQEVLTYSATLVGPSCSNLTPVQGGQLTLNEEQAVSYITTDTNNGSATVLDIVRLDNNFDDLIKPIDGLTKIRIIYRVQTVSDFSLTSQGKTTVTGVLQPETHVSNNFIIESERDYTLTIDGETALTKISLDEGGVYSLLFVQNLKNMTNLITLTPPNTIHILWQLPQIIVISVGEIMFSITGLEFSYCEAPNSMKSVISSLWLLTDSFGNILVIVITEFMRNVAQVYILSLFAVLMVLVMLGFILLAKRHTKVMEKFNSTESPSENNAHL